MEFVICPLLPPDAIAHQAWEDKSSDDFEPARVDQVKLGIQSNSEPTFQGSQIGKF